MTFLSGEDWALLRACCRDEQAVEQVAHLIGRLLAAADPADTPLADIYRVMVTRAPLGLGVLQHDRLVFANPALATHFGCSLNDLLRDFSGALDRVVAADSREALQRGLQATPPQRQEIRLVGADADSRWLDIQPAIITCGGQPAILLSALDITGHKQTEAALRASEERYRVISERGSDYAFALIVAPDVPYTLEWVSASFTAITGFKLEEIGGRWLRLIHPGDRQRAVDALQKILPPPGETELECRIVHKSGETRHIITRFRSEAHPADSQRSRVYGAVQDVTESRLAQQKALELATERERTRILTNFIQNASHEFRTPLSLISTSLYLMERVQEPERRQKHRDQILQQVKHIASLLDDMLTMSRLDSGSDLIQHRATDLNRLLQAVELTLKPLMEKKRHIVRHEFDPNLPAIKGDPESLHTALANLVYNAVRYTPAGGTITLRTFTDEAFAVVEIQDTGVGISQTVVKRIFERFYREDEAHTTPGLGLGLPISNKIIEQHHGWIEVDSQPGRGSTFKVRLPLER